MTWHTTLKTENTELGGIEGEGPADHRITGITGSPRVLTPSKPWQYPYWVPNTLSIPLYGVSRYSKNSNIYQGIHVYIYIYILIYTVYTSYIGTTIPDMS
jgi:hypothetical protein